MKLAVGCDHGGFEVLESIRAYLKEKGIEYVDFGTHSTDSVDYPLLYVLTFNWYRELYTKSRIYEEVEIMAREVLILGATGKIAGHAIDALLANGNDELLLFTRHHMHEKTLV